MSPLAGCRVLDLGIITAGAATSAILADLGAEVIKVESPTYKDPFRKWTGETLPGEHPDLPPFFRMSNRGKLNVGIDLKTTAGRGVLLDLVAKSDVVVENFSRGVLDRLGLGFDVLKAANPAVILASISSQGDDGPDAGHVSFGSTLEAMAGLAAITGDPDGPPVVSGIELNYPDQVVAIFAASMIATAWFAAGREGAVHLDLSQRELTSFLCGEAFLAPDAPRRGNGHEAGLLQDCFRCADGSWLALTVPAERRAAFDARFGTDAATVAAAIGGLAPEAAAAAARALGAAAAIVLDGSGVLAERGRGWSTALGRATDGETVKGGLFATDAPARPHRPATLLGVDTRDVLARVCGYTAERIEALIAAGALAEDVEPGTQPARRRA